MANPVWGAITSLFKPAADLVDSLHTSEEERLRARGELMSIQAQLVERVLDYEARLLEAQTSVIKAEALGASWMQRNWRPITMLTFLVLVIADTFGLTEFRLSEQAWTLLQIGLGGYVVGRSVEKVVPSALEAMKK